MRLLCWLSLLRLHRRRCRAACLRVGVEFASCAIVRVRATITARVVGVMRRGAEDGVEKQNIEKADDPR